MITLRFMDELRVVDELGPEAMVFVNDPETGMRGLLVIDNSVLGPTGGGARMAVNITPDEIADLARAMTYKFGILGLPRGGCKSGIWGDASMPKEQKKQIMRSFGKMLAPFLSTKHAAIGPDMGVSVDDVRDMYDGAGVEQLRSGLFAQLLDKDPLAYHLTGHGVVASTKAACEVIGLPFKGAIMAVEGFGQVGVGTCRRAAREGAIVVAVSTMEGAVYNAKGLDIELLCELRRQHGDRCVLEYTDGERLAKEELCFLPVDIVVPGARPWVITESNSDRVKAKLISSGGNITVTDRAQERLYRRGVWCTPEFIVNSGGAVASWVDFLGGNVQQAFGAIDHLLGAVTSDVMKEAMKQGKNPYLIATDRVKARIKAARGQPRKSFDQTRVEIKALLHIA